MTKQTSQTQRQRKFEAEGCLNLLLSRISAPISAVRTKLSAPFTKLASRLPAVNIKKTRHRLFLISVAGIVLTAPIVWAFIAHPWSTEAAWWDDHWLYRQKIAIPYTGSTELTDFQIELAAVDTTGLNSAGKLESNCDDLRFTDNHGDLLPYWINDESDSNDTLDCSANNYDIWVKIPSIPQSGTDIYMYYGNPNAESVISGNETFDYFDDFTLGTIDDSKWITNGSPATGSANISLLDFDALVSKSSFCNSSPGDNDSCAVGMRAKQSSTGLNAGRIGFTSLEGFDSIEWWNTNFSRRKQITVSATDAVDTGYTVSYSALGSDAADIYNDCLSSGDDFRIVYWDSDSWLELDRKLVTFTSSAIEVWFALQKDIGASSSDNNYFIYYDYGASGSPPAD